MRYHRPIISSSRNFANLFDVLPCALKMKLIYGAGEKSYQNGLIFMFYNFFSFFNIALFYNYSKPVLRGHTKIDKTKVLKTNGSLMNVESIAECSLGAFCNTYDLH